jgi:hypothetical protein
MKIALLAALSMAGCAPISGPPSATSDPRTVDQAPAPTSVLEIEQQIMGAEAAWHSCLFGAASHFGARAGRAGPGAPPPPDPFVECKSDGDRLQQLLAASPIQPPPGGTFVERSRRISGPISEAYMAAYQANNYE